MNEQITLLGDDHKMALLVIEKDTCILIVIADPTTTPHWTFEHTHTPVSDLPSLLQAMFSGWYLCDPTPNLYPILDTEGFINALR